MCEKLTQVVNCSQISIFVLLETTALIKHYKEEVL